jgi:carboxyl-terminal processing protease
MKKVFLGILIGSFCWNGWTQETHSAPAASPQPAVAETKVSEQKIKDEDARYRSTMLFANVLELVRDEYVDPSKVDYDKLTYAALRGMLTSLDPHSQFLDPENYKDMQMETQGQFGGLGISVGKVDGYLTVNVPIEGAPAAKAGLLPADRIIKIGNRSTKNITLSESIKMLRGEPGDAVVLTVYRPETKEYKELKIVRELIDVPTVRDANILSDSTEKIGYVRLTQFGDKTVEEMEKALKNLQKQSITCLILDLRNNPGGLLEAAVEVAGKFLPTGTTVVSTEGRLGEAERTLYQSPGRQRILDIPLVVLINGNSASGSEIVAGALQDWRRAVLIGETTFGKGSVQTVQPLANSIDIPTALRLTTDRYYTPKRRLIHGTGIAPDISAPITWEEERDLFLKRSLALLNAEEKARVEKVQDSQLDRAIQVIKGLRQYSQKNDLNLAPPTAVQ